MNEVKSVGPEHARIMLVGEAPGAEEEKLGEPFVGYSGRILTGCLQEAGIRREDCRITNVVRTRPPNNNFEVFYEGKGAKRKPSAELVKAYDRLRCEIASCQPNIVVCLGAEALKAVTPHASITNHRGSVLATPYGKVIPAFHPAFILRDWTARPVLVFDLRKALRESGFAEVRRQPLRLYTNPTKDQVRAYLEECYASRTVSFDVETESGQITCIAFSCTPETSLCIPFWFGTSGSLWPEGDEQEIWQEIKAILEDPEVTKIAQNGTYDCEILKSVYGIHVQGFQWDTMLMAHVLYPELPKGLDFLTSIYTDIPYYKDKLKTDDRQEYWEYNAKDALATLRVYQAQRKELTDAKLENFYRKHVHALIEPLAAMVEQGVRFDVRRKEEAKRELEESVSQLQAALDEAVGHPLNINSPKQMQKWLYEELKLPVQKKRRKGKAEPTTTTDEEALEKLYAKTKNEALKTVIKIRENKKLISTYIDVNLDPDLRIRCSYNITGTETGRLSSSTTARGTGTNLQNIPTGIIKSLFIADEGYVIINADLSQAEARVVAYIGGDARLISVFETGGDIHRKNASAIFRVPEDQVTFEQRYLAKRVVHASNYGMGARTFAKEAGIPEREADKLLKQYFATYPRIKLWQQETADVLRRTRVLTTPFGRKRTFFNRWDDSLIKEGLAYVPQSTVADLVNLAIIRLHERLRGRDDIRLLLQVHDSIVAEAREETLEEAVRMIREEMLIPLTIKGRTFTIPVDVKVGPNWEDVHPLTEPAPLLKVV